MVDQRGRRFVVTGGSTGIGAATARALALRGAHVILAVRDLEKGRRAASTMSGDIEVRALDVSRLASIRDFAASVDTPVAVLVHNAAVMGQPRVITADGWELHLATNFLGPFALTGWLLPRITDRVVVVSSHAHRHASLGLDDWHMTRGYASHAAYARSKLALLSFSLELDRRLRAASSPVRSVAAHPGLARSALLDGAEPTTRMRVTRWLQMRFGQSAASGAAPIVFAATAPVEGGSYVGPGGWFGLRGAPALVSSSPTAQDRTLATAVWAAAVRETGVDPAPRPTLLGRTSAR